MSTAFEVLLELQEHDTRADQLRHRRATLPDKAELAKVRSALAETRGRAAAVQAQRDEHGARQESLEGQIEASRSRRAELEKRMFGGHVTAAKDLQAMDEEVRHLARHIAELEDREIEVMELLEPLDAELAAAADDGSGLERRAAELEQRVTDDEAAIDAEVLVEEQARDSLVAQVPADLFGRYEGLRAKLGGTGIARLAGGSCTGCHLALPAMEVDRIKKLPADTVVICDNCGRILVR